MKNQSESDFYKRLNDIDDPNSGNWIGMAIIFALSGLVAGFIIGYLLGYL